MKVELSKLSYNDFLVMAENDKRKEFKELKNHIDRRLPLCLGIQRNERHKTVFLLDALANEDWAQKTLSFVGASTSC